MLNNVILVGRLVGEPEVKTLESGLSVSTIVLAVSRSYKGADGEIGTDFIKCSLWEGVATAASTYCKKGSIIGIKGRLTTREIPITLENGETINYTALEVIGDRVSFIKT